MLLPSVPSPMDSGAKIRNHGLLKLLAAEHEVHAIAFGASQDQKVLASLARRSKVVPLPPNRSGTRRALDIARSDFPDMAMRLWSDEFSETVRCFAAEEDYEAVQAEGIEMARYLRPFSLEQRVYDAHNAEFLFQRRLASSGSLLARMYSRLQWRRLERFERDVLRESRMTLAVSQHDANQLLALSGIDADVQVVPNAIDVSAYCFSPPSVERASNLLFLGRLDFRPNALAVEWFLEEVLRRLPQARLFAVGARPPDWLIEAGKHDDRVAVTGYVPDDGAYVQRCAAMVLPFQSGGGSRLKALVAMASGLPIVSTRLGMEGLDAEAETHYVLAESASDWVTALGRILGDLELRRRLAGNARRLVEDRYDWPAVRQDVNAAYEWLTPA